MQHDRTDQKVPCENASNYKKKLVQIICKIKTFTNCLILVFNIKRNFTKIIIFHNLRKKLVCNVLLKIQTSKSEKFTSYVFSIVCLRIACANHFTDLLVV